MIVTLLIIIEADRLHQVFRKNLLHLFCVSIQDAFIERGEFFFLCLLFKPPQNGIFIHIPHLAVRNRHLHIDGFPLLTLADLFEITGKEKEVPQVILGGIHIIICDVFVNRLCNRTARNQRLDLLLYGDVRVFHQIFHDAVRTGVRPVRLRKCVFITITGVYIINHTPGIINFCFSKPVTVIPSLYCFQVVFQSIVL